MWILILLASACGGALLLWHSVSRTKHVSEEMLKIYAKILSDARERRARELAEQPPDDDAETDSVEADARS